MQITFDTQNPNDLKLLNELLARFESPKNAANAQPEVANTGTAASELPPSAEGSSVSEPVAAEPAPAAPVKRSRMKPQIREEAEVVAEAAPEPAPAPESKPVTLDEVRAALQAFTAAHGVPAGIELLKGFEAGRISELKPEQYGAFVKGCAV